MKKIVFAGIILSSFIACDSADDATTKSTIVTFESGQNLLDPNGEVIAMGSILLEGSFAAGTYNDVFWAKDYSEELEKPCLDDDHEGDDHDDHIDYQYFNDILFTTADKKARFGSFFYNHNNNSPSDYWHGIIISGNYNTSAQSSEEMNQFCVWSKSGAVGSKYFAVCSPETVFEGYDTPTIKFATSVQPQSIYLANSSVLYKYAHKSEFVVLITGYLNGSETQSVRFPLVSEKGVAVNDWTKIDLTTLGEVYKITLTVECDDIYAPKYFCFDNFEFI